MSANNLMSIFSPAQIAGYVAFILGVTAFLQKSDQRLKIILANQSWIYALHFLLLGNPPAAISALISSARTFLSLKYRSLYLAAAIIAVNLAAGAAFARSGAGWLPVIGSCAATAAMFTMRGVPLRLVLLSSTLMWLANGILSHSIGGTLLELFVASANISTMLHMGRNKSLEAAGAGLPE